MNREELARAIQLVEYGLGVHASGYLPGIHRGHFYGTAGKLVGYTSLLHRMDPKNIDLAATRRALSPVPLVRLYQAKVAITVAALVDLSASMGFVGRTRKMAEAAKLAACLSYSAYRLGDRFTLLGFGDEVELHFPPKRSPDYPWEIGETLWGYEPTSRSVRGLESACALLPRRRSLVFLISDFHFEPESLERALAYLRRHDGILVALWDPAEGGGPLRLGWTEWYDPETGERSRLWMRRGFAHRFQRTFEDRRAWITQLCRRFGAEALFVETGIDPIAISRFFLSRRS